MPTTKPDYNKNYYANHKDVMQHSFLGPPAVKILF